MLKVHRGLSLLIAAALISTAEAAVIEYDAVNLSGSTWRYDYQLTNDTLAAPVDEFTIYFDRTLFSDLRDLSGAADWDLFAAQSDPNLPDDGYFDGLALGAPLAPGASLSGFSVTFDFLGAGTPGAQSFEFIDAATFTVLASGQTTLRSPQPPVTVPEPSTLALLLLGMCAVALRRTTAVVRPRR